MDFKLTSSGDDHRKPRGKYSARSESEDKAGDHWNTPRWLARELTSFFGQLGLDPCSNETSIVKSAHRYTERDNGLTAPWSDVESVFVNPPYSCSQSGKWIGKALSERAIDPRLEIVLLLPSTTGTPWFINGASQANAICFLKGRLHFLGAKFRATFASVLVYLGRRPSEFADHFCLFGTTMIPEGRLSGAMDEGPGEAA